MIFADHATDDSDFECIARLVINDNYFFPSTTIKIPVFLG